MKEEQDKLVAELRNAKCVISDLEDSLRKFTYALAENPYKTWLEYLHIELSNAHNSYEHNKEYCKENGLSIELIQNEARLDCLIQLIRSIPLVFVPEELKEMYGLTEEEEN